MVAVVVTSACSRPASSTTTTTTSTGAPPSDAGAVLTSVEQGPITPAPPHDPTVADGTVGTWKPGTTAPSSPVKPFARREETAPGRSDSAGQISGYCPPKANVFEMGDGRALVTREPCSGVTEISIRERTGTRMVADSLLYGVTGTWSVVRVDRDLVLMISQGTVTNLQLVDLATARARWIRMPNEYERAQGLNVGVAGSAIYLWGGTLEQALGSEGCDGVRQPGQGCDPVPVVRMVPNKKVWVWSR